ncbi:unnamed protein product [Nezara viridula]|nr:unnamed protein product [Nezara viridula]
MVKFVMSFLFSFKSFPENGVQFYPHLSEKTEDDTEELYLRFKAHPDRKNICNITYIIPGPRELVEKKISVACWSPMLKVYNRKEDYHFQTECTGDKTWAAFSVRQTLDNIKLEQFKNIFPKSLEFYFNEDQKSVQRFRNDPYGAYFSPKIPKENRFGPVFYLKDLTKQPARVKPEYGTIQQNNRKKEVSVSRKQPETTTRIKTSDPDICRTVAAAHLHKILKILRTKKDTNPPMTPRSPSNCAMFLPVAKLFYDKSVWVLKNDRPMTRNVQDVYVFVTVYSFLDEEARKIINPISIYLQSLQYLPLKELQAKG